MSLSFRTQSRLATLIQTIAEAEKKTEVTRQVLAEQKLFEPHTAFRRLDLTRDGYVSSSELIDFLNQNNVVATTKEQLALFSGLDYNEDGLISYNDFVNTVLPQEDQKLKSLATLRESYYLEPGQALPYEVEWGLARVFEQEIKNYRNIENMKDVLAASYDYNTLDAFNTIDEEMLGFIDFESIDNFQRNQSKILSEDEIAAFLRVVGENGRVTYTQFANALGGTRSINTSISSPSKLERVASPFKSRDLYYNTLQEQLNRSLEAQRQLQLESRIIENQERLNRSIELQKSQAKLDRLERTIERQRSQEKLQELERSIEKRRNLERLERSIELQRSQEKLERTIERQRSQERIRALERSIDLQRSQEKIRRQVELERSQEKLDRLNRSIELQRSQERLNRSIELQRSQERLNRSIERSRQLQLETELQRSQRKRQQDQAELELELQRSINRSRQLESEILEQSINKGSNYNTPSRSKYSTTFKEEQPSQVSPMKGNEESQLVASLKQQVNIDREIEEIRKQLSLRVDFNLLDAFRIFDSKSRGYVTKLEFELALNQIGIYPTKDELYLLFKRYDTDSDGLLRYSEFTKICSPQSSEYSTLMSNRSPHYLDNASGIETFDHETRYIFKKLLNKVLQGEVEAEALRQKLARRPLFSATDAFNAIDSNENGFISIDEFKAILNEWGFFVTTNDLVSLVNRYDKNQDGKVSYGEFLNEITPKSPMKY